MQAIFQEEASSVDVNEALDNLFADEKVADGSKQFAINLANGVMKNINEIDGHLTRSLKNWSMDRISSVDKSILRLALYEIIFEKATPKAVVINEALELAKRYSDKDSARFVNGILGSFVV